MSYQRRYKLKDDRFGLLALTLRKRAGLRQAEVATVLNVSLRTIQHWEGGTAYPAVTNLKDLIVLYLRKSAFTIGRERDEAKAFWEQAAESASRRKALFDEVWFDNLLKQQEQTQPYNALHELVSPQGHTLSQADWGEAIDGTTFYGRESELAVLEQWVIEERCRLVLLLGRGGIGKTTLSVRFAQNMVPHFDFVLWRSLRNAPPLEGLLTDCVQALFIPHPPSPAYNEEKNIALLIELLRKRHCLLVFDNVESLLQAGTLEGEYRHGYEGYGILFQRIAQTLHQSCLLLTSREMLSELEPLEGTHTAVRELKLAGLGQTASQELLKDKDLFGTQQDWEHLVQHYSGNPLALKIVAATVRDIFGGSIAAFVHEGPITLHTLKQLLQQQFVRLTALEQDVLYWLAIERELVSLEILRNDLPKTLPKSELLVAIKSLRQRCFIERGARIATFTLQPEVMEYVSERLVEQISEEIVNESLKLFISHALLKAQSSNDVRESQIRMLVQPLLNRLLTHFGNEQNVEKQLHLMLHLLREKPPIAHDYGGGNVVNLLSSLKGHLRNADFSSLTIRQAYLQGIEAQDANFSHASISETLFMEPVGSIASMTLSPDGSYVAAGSFSGHIFVWRVADRSLLLTLQGHSRMTWAIAFSPDSTMLASGGYDSMVKLWEIQREQEPGGRCLKTFSGHDKWVRSIAFSADGMLLASTGDDETIRIWDIQEGTCLRVLRGHNGIIWSVALSPDGNLLVTGGDDETVRVWNTHTGTCLNVLHEHTGMVMTVAFHPAGHMFASGGDDGAIHLWDVASNCRLATLRLHSRRAASIAFNAEGTLLASGSQNGEVEVWRIAEERGFSRLRTLPGHPIWVSTVAFGLDGLLASISYGGQVKLWEVENGRCLGTIQGYSHVICALTFSPDGDLLAHGDDHGILRVWDVRSGRCLKTFQAHAGRIWSIHFSPNGKILASGGDDQGARVKLWKAEGPQGGVSERCMRTLYGHTTMVWSVAFSPDGNLLASSGADWTVKIWRVGVEARSDDITILEGHTTMVWAVAFSADGSRLASGDNDGVIKVWEVATGQCLMTLQNGPHAVGTLVFSEDGDTLQSCDNDEYITRWDVCTGQVKHRQRITPDQEHANWAKAIAFNQEGTMLALGCDQHSVTLYHTEPKSSVQVLRTPALQGGQVWSVAFSPDNHLLASGDDDGNLVLWDIETGTCRQVLRSDRPYERMNIYDVKGIIEAQRDSLKALGAIEETE